MVRKQKTQQQKNAMHEKRLKAAAKRLAKKQQKVSDKQAQSREQRAAGRAKAKDPEIPPEKDSDV